MHCLCIHCDYQFQLDEGEKPRCPKCLRVHGIEIVRDIQSSVWRALKGRRTFLTLASAIAIVLSGFAWWALRPKSAKDTEAPLRPLEPAELHAALRARGAGSIEDLERLLAPTASVRKFASRILGGRSRPAEKARAVYEAIRVKAEMHAFVPWSFNTARKEPIRMASEVLGALNKNSNNHLYPLEVVALGVAMLRAGDVDAMVGEAYAFPGERLPPDPTGQHGYYVIVLNGAQGGKGKPLFFDVYGGRKTRPKPEDYRILSDVQAIAAAVSERAFEHAVSHSDPSKAFELSKLAVTLDKRSPCIRSVAGMVLLDSGAVIEGLQEIESAAQLRPDGPRRINLASIYLAHGDLERAERETRAALEVSPDFAGGRATLAAIHFVRGENEKARPELEAAERVDPGLPQLPLLWAHYHLASGNLDSAVGYADRAIAQRPHDWQIWLEAARIYQSCGKKEKADHALKVAIERVPSSRRAAIEEMARSFLSAPGQEVEPEPIRENLPSSSSASDLRLTDPSENLTVDLNKPKGLPLAH